MQEKKMIPRVCTGRGKAKLFSRAVEGNKPMAIPTSTFRFLVKRNKGGRRCGLAVEDDGLGT